LTPENYYKIGLIFMRIQAKIPVILMGETGIGKTSLIRLLSYITEDPIRIINIHAGVTSEDIQKKLDEIENEIIEN
jgi:E3 ubiquitin-protein ligase RNF213